MNRTLFFARWLVRALLAATAAWTLAAAAQTPALDPEAVELLRRSTNYLAGLKQFRADTQASIEMVTSDGQKLQFDQHVIVSVQRPNMMRTERVGEIVKQSFYYDGKSLSVNLPDYGYYATVAAPATLDATLTFARDKLDVIAPAADLLYGNAFDLLSAGLTSAIFIGESVVAGVRCNHLAFRNAEVDWQICIEQGAKPLPRKLVITSKRMAQSPQFAVVFDKWDTAPKFSAATFAFNPPKGARKVDWLPAAAKK